MITLKQIIVYIRAIFLSLILSLYLSVFFSFFSALAFEEFIRAAVQNSPYGFLPSLYHSRSVRQGTAINIIS